MFLRLVDPDATEDMLQQELDNYTNKSGVGLIEVTSAWAARVPHVAGFVALRDLLMVRCPLLVSISLDNQPVLAQLNTLVLDHSSLSELPDNLADATPLLEVLSVEGNALRRLPALLPSRIVVLLVAENRLRRVPRLDRLKSLQRLSFRDNPWLPQGLAVAAADRRGCVQIVERVQRAHREWCARDAAKCLLLIRWCRRNEHGLLGLVPKELVREMAQEMVRDAANNSAWDL
jgi:hypothetical protein